MKSKIVITAIALLMTVSSATFATGKNNTGNVNTISENVLNKFQKQFKNSVQPVIYESKTGFIVQSQADAHNVTAAYGIKGNWLYSITFFAEDNLAKNVMETVRQQYENYYISGMEKVDQPGSCPVFIVHIKNNTSYKTLRVINNDVELMKDISKA